MDKKTKVFLTVIADLILIGIIVFSVYIVATRYDSNLGNVFSWIIVLAIPTMFYFSYMTFAGDKYEYKEGMFDEEEENDDAVDDAETELDGTVVEDSGASEMELLDSTEDIKK